MTWIAAGVAVGGLVMGGVQQSQARSAAHKQADEVKRQVAERERKINALYDRMGMANKASIERSTQSAIGQAGQAATDRGFGNTSVYDTLQGQARADGLQAQLQSQQNMAQGRAGALSDVPIAIPDKPAAGNGGELIGKGIGSLADILKSLNANPNTVQTMQTQLTPQQTNAGGAYEGGQNAAFVPPPPQSVSQAPQQPAAIAGAPSWANVIGSKRRGVVNPYGMSSPYAARYGG